MGGRVGGGGGGGGSRQPEVAAAHLMGRAPELDLFHYCGRAYLSKKEQMQSSTDVFCFRKLTVPSVSFSSSVTKLQSRPEQRCLVSFLGYEYLACVLSQQV